MNEHQLRMIYDRTEGHCHFCGDKVDFEKRGWKPGDLIGYWEVDHVIQRDKGGPDVTENCLPACTRCNRLRWHRTGDEIRELLLLGLVARDQIRKDNELGHTLEELRKKRLEENERRRQS